MRKFTTRVVLRKRKKKRRKEGKKNTRITRRALVFCAFSLRLLDLDSSGLGALILALPVQQALRRVSLTSFPADADAPPAPPVCERDLTNGRMCMGGGMRIKRARDEKFPFVSPPTRYIPAATKNFYLVHASPLPTNLPATSSKTISLA